MGNNSSAARCDRCSRPVGGTAYLCTRCGGELSRHLRTVTALVADVRAAVAGQSRHTTGAGGTGAVRLELDLQAGARLDAITNALTTWTRSVIEERAGAVEGGDRIAACAAYLAEHVEWLRHQQFANEAFKDIAACSRLMLGILDGPGERRWLGQCGSVVDTGRCSADLYIRLGSTVATCHTCKTRHDVAEREAWLDETVRDYSYTPREIQDAYGIPAGTIRVWAHRRRIVATGQVDGQPVYSLGEVLDFAAAEHARKAIARERRQRRAEEEAGLIAVTVTM